MHFSQLLKRLWTHHIKLTAVFDLLVFYFCSCASVSRLNILIYMSAYGCHMHKHARAHQLNLLFALINIGLYPFRTLLQSSILHPKIFGRMCDFFVLSCSMQFTVFFCCVSSSVSEYINATLRSALSSAVYYWILWFSSPNGWRAMLIYFELLILCLCCAMSKSYFQRFSIAINVCICIASNAHAHSLMPWAWGLL